MRKPDSEFVRGLLTALAIVHRLGRPWDSWRDVLVAGIHARIARERKKGARK